MTTQERITSLQGLPKRIKVDVGLEFISMDLDRWVYWNHVELDFSRLGKLSDNALIDTLMSGRQIELVLVRDSTLMTDPGEM